MSDTQSPPSKRPSLIQVLFQILFGFVLPVGVLIVAVYFGNKIVNSGPTADRKPRPRVAKLVETIQVNPSSTPVMIQAMGLVVPAREVRLTPQVSGHITWLSPKLVPGGSFKAGETLIKLDDADYRIVMQQREAEIAQIQADISIEQGRQLVAKREYELLGEEIDASQQALVLRKPQLAALEARLAQAKAQLAGAELDLSRTNIVAPFNAQVNSRMIELGTQVSTGTVLAELNGTDHYWVRATLPVDELKWLSIPRNPDEPGSQTTITNDSAWGQDQTRSGHISQLQASLESDGRMAQLLITVADPLSLQADNTDQPALLLGSYVRAEIQGKAAADIYELPRQWLRSDDTVWLMDKENRLDIRPVGVLHRSRDSVLINRGLEPGSTIVTTNLSAPVQAMPLRTSGSGTPAPGRGNTEISTSKQGEAADTNTDKPGSKP